jgi:hypothetical protein
MKRIAFAMFLLAACGGRDVASNGDGGGANGNGGNATEQNDAGCPTPPAHQCINCGDHVLCGP